MNARVVADTQTVRIPELPLSLEAARDPLPPLRDQLRALGLPAESLSGARVYQRALDARPRPPRYVFTVIVEAPGAVARKLIARQRAFPHALHAPYRLRLPRRPDGPRPLIVGAGPAGLFAAMTFAEAGWPAVILERGRAVEARSRDVSRLYAHGELDPESNVCYGEGGAGTYSDGKLYTRVGDPRVEHVLRLMVARGADPDILVNTRPHLGTDRLVELLHSVREHVTSLGTTYRFETALDDFEIADGALRAVRLRGGERLDVGPVVLCTGHSAREVWERLHARGLPLESRPFAVGFRVEHPQALIDELRYGRASQRGLLPAADYKLTYNERDGERRGCWSFCMCPGGVVVTTPTRPEELCINGMSHAARAGRFANSALVVSVGPADYARAGFTGVFAGVELQTQAERAAYQAGGGEFTAPAARVGDFVAGKISSDLGHTSYRRGLAPADLRALYSAEVISTLEHALRRFDRSMRGFITNEARLIGVETRTSSPVRVPRGEDMQALGARGLYPAGEGMGYGGGIVSAAVDGIRAAEAALMERGAVREELGSVP